MASSLKRVERFLWVVWRAMVLKKNRNFSMGVSHNYSSRIWLYLPAAVHHLGGVHLRPLESPFADQPVNSV